ncbi:pyrroline-5-carboxylate reductase [Candidatus Pantoea edessiphila]|uniref:Pyrroline-5-carboxylate reductase n=1 Tax=Candidatus Pantoea edessiphila TaxID=2044610 RepID=A0A2P5SVL7_9GAMM|nr:pyrroline-5-carboxylate reductase [Candidatus Pantoea edessiphila]PPI86350.1 pyrroline-5-carboxylate reductase [Candidatus Pantoea edessiphila]
MKKNIGFIGVGNIAQSIIKGLSRSEYIAPSQIWIYDHKLTTNKEVSLKYKVNYTESNIQLVKKVDVLFISLKPHVILKELQNISNSIKENTIIISLAAGITINAIESVIGVNRKIIRAMPNINSSICAGMTSITPNSFLNKFEIDLVESIFRSFSETHLVDEKLIHSVIGISSSAPAYVFILIEAMADAAVLSGMTYSKAYQFASQAVKGSAQMLLETRKHPGELRNMVCSPGGTTIESIKVLEQKNFRSAIIEAVYKCILKSRELSM